MSFVGTLSLACRRTRLGAWAFFIVAVATVIVASAIGLAFAAPSVASPMPAPAEQQKRMAVARRVAAGELLYAAGRFAEALKAFEEAQAQIPQWETRFHIARCHENLGHPRAALKAYREALKTVNDAARRDQIVARIHRLERRPGRLFVATDPSGARVRVDVQAGHPTSGHHASGDAVPASSPGRHLSGGQGGVISPAVLRLAPGGHVITFDKAGYRDRVLRVVVTAGMERMVRVKLRALPASRPALCVPKRIPVPGPSASLTRFGRLHLDLGVGFTLFGARGWGVQEGPNLLLHAAVGRLVVGLNVLVMPILRDLPDSLASGFASLTLAHFDVAWAFPFAHFYILAGGAAGGYLDRVADAKGIGAIGTSLSQGGFSWGAFGAIHAMLVPWVSLALRLRAGAMHGARLNDALEVDARHIFPYVSLSSALVFHVGT